MGIDTTTWLRSLPVLTGAAPDLSGLRWSADPAVQFLAWLAEAVEAGVPEPQVGVLSTASDTGLPDGRALIVRDVDARGVAFAGTRSSAKAEQLAVNPAAGFTFWWQPQMRSIRMRGAVVPGTESESRADFELRPGVRRNDAAAADWQLWRLIPEQVEFFQGAADRRHLRVVYVRDSAEHWTVSSTIGGEPTPLDLGGD